MSSLVSVIIPVYNMGNKVRVMIDSLIAQDYNNMEIIVVDDGSTDKSFEICESLLSSDERSICYHTENRGSGPARNLGIQKANGEFIYFPDADDYLEPNAISCMVEAMQDNHCDLVVFGFKYINTRGICVKEKTYDYSLRDACDIKNDYSECMSMDWKWGIQGAPWNKLFKRSIIIENKVEFPPLRRHQDDGFIGRYMCYVNRVLFIPNVLYYYYTNDLKKEWEKYPENYIESVVGLYEVRKQTILKWNTEDRKTKMVIERSYVNSFIKALELSFSPKNNLSYKDRFVWIQQQISKYQFDSFEGPDGLGLYHKTVCSIIHRKKWVLLMIVLQIKVLAELHGLVDIFKRLHRS